MGAALAGKRDKVFLMTKFAPTCPDSRARRRPSPCSINLAAAQDGPLDLWQVHQIGTEAEADSIFVPGGVIEAIEQARQQGKIRYCGFTGMLIPRCISGPGAQISV